MVQWGGGARDSRQMQRLLIFLHFKYLDPGHSQTIRA